MWLLAAPDGAAGWCRGPGMSNVPIGDDVPVKICSDRPSVDVPVGLAGKQNERNTLPQAPPVATIGTDGGTVGVTTLSTAETPVPVGPARPAASVTPAVRSG